MTTVVSPPAPPQAPPGSPDEPTPGTLWAPLAAGFVMFVSGVFSLVTGAVLLFPSLGPTAVQLAYFPRRKGSRPYNVVVSHLTGIAVAYVAVAAFGIGRDPSPFVLHHLTAARVWAAVLAVMAAALLEILLDARHPPAASTTLLVALGDFKLTLRDAVVVVAGVLLVAAVGEALRFVRLRTEAA